MQNLREKLMSAGLITESQKVQADKSAERRASGGSRKRRRPRRSGTGYDRPVDVADEKLAIMQAIEQGRVRGDTRGVEEFHFEMRDARIRKMFVTAEIAHGLTSGRFAIVEAGEADRHVLVNREAVPAIKAADAQAVRFFNGDGTTS